MPSPTEHYLGDNALAGSLNATSPRIYDLSVAQPRVPAGATITFHVFVPSGSTIAWLEPYALQGPPSNLRTGAMITVADLSIGNWTTLTVDVPANAGPLRAIGVRFNVTAPWVGTVYIDSIDW